MPHYRLGEYPSFVYNTYGLDLEKGTVVQMPAPLYDNGVLSSSVVFSLNSSTDQQWKFTFGEDFSALTRYLFIVAGKRSYKPVATYILGLYDGSHSVETADASIGNRGEDVALEVEAHNNSVKVTHPDGVFYSLAPFFRSYLKLSSLLQHASLNNKKNIVFDEKVIVRDVNPKKITVKFFCEDIDNEIFTSSCEQVNSDNQLVLRRKLVLKKANFDKYGDDAALTALQSLESISQSYVTVKP